MLSKTSAALIIELKDKDRTAGLLHALAPRPLALSTATPGENRIFSLGQVGRREIRKGVLRPLVEGQSDRAPATLARCMEVCL